MRHWTLRGREETYGSKAGADEGLKREQSQREETETSHLERNQKRNGERSGRERMRWKGNIWLHVCKTGDRDYLSRDSMDPRAVLRLIFFLLKQETRVL